jgi:uncharacterized protein YecE (DUF72 family)
LNQKKNLFYCGTSNIVLPAKNKSFFPAEYQDKSRLRYYSSLLNSLEVNSTFYKLPLARTVEKWAQDVPEYFKFTFKLSKSITHAKELEYDVNELQRFFDVVDHAGNKKGCILVQFPASIKISNFQKIKRLLDDIASSANNGEWNIAVEFRDPSWYRDQVYQTLEYYKASIVMHDMPKSYTPLIDMERSFIYIRFHGEAGDYRGGYSDDFLRDHAANILDWLREGLPVYAYFNNTIGDAIHNAMTLDSYLQG